MSKGRYRVIDGVTRKAKTRYLVIGGVTRKIKKSYRVVDGITRLCYSADPFTYTGDYTVSQVEIEGAAYDMYTLTSGGVLSIADDAQFWMCGGGEGGESAKGTRDYAQAGHGGSGGHISSGTLAAGTYPITIGAGGAADAVGGDSSIGETYIAKGGGNVVNGAYGGSGGGGGGYVSSTGTRTQHSGRSGAGESTVPFGLASMQKHCAGGGGGTAQYRAAAATYYYSSGGAGGSNGADGTSGNISASASNRAAGGEYGGGKGGSTNDSPSAGSFYGAGGGGGSASCDGTSKQYSVRNSRAGYQGVCYILLPVKTA